MQRQAFSPTAESSRVAGRSNLSLHSPSFRDHGSLAFAAVLSCQSSSSRDNFRASRSPIERTDRGMSLALVQPLAVARSAAILVVDSDKFPLLGDLLAFNRPVLSVVVVVFASKTLVAIVVERAG